MLNNNKIKIAMLEISDQNKAVLEFYFNSAGEEFYTLVGKDKADALISDYDYPGAKADIKNTLEASNKPIVILSVREQNIPSTIWLSKPLSALALTEAAEKITKILSDKKSTPIATEAKKSSIAEPEELKVEEVALVESVEEIQEKVEKPEELTVDTNSNDSAELALDKEVESEEKEDDFFALLAEANELDDESHDEVIERASIRTAKMTALGASAKSLIDSSVNSTEKTSVKTSSRSSEGHSDSQSKISQSLIDESSLLVESAGLSSNTDNVDNTEELNKNTSFEFNDVDIDDQSFNSEPELNTDSEVDALLESLISGTGGMGAKKVASSDDIDLAIEDSEADKKDGEKDESNDLFLDSLSLDEEPSDIILEEEDAVSTDDEMDLVDLLDDELLLDVDDGSDEQEKTVVEDKQNLMMEENFLLHDDQNPSDEDVYTDTLEVNYFDVKDKGRDDLSNTDEDALIEVEDVNDSSLEPSLELSLEKSDEPAEDNILDVMVEDDQLETDLFTFELDSKVSEDGLLVEDSNEIDSSEPSKTPYLTVLDNVDGESSKLAPDAETFDLQLEEGFDSGLDMDSDLDSLLREVAIEDTSIIEKLESTSDEVFEISAASKIDDDFESLQSFDKAEEIEPESNNSPDFELQSLLNEVRKEAVNNSGSGDDSSQTDGHSPTQAEKRWVQLCGNLPSIDDQKQFSKVSFDLNDHLLGVLLNQVESTKGSEQLFRLKYNDLIIVIDHSKNKIYCNLPVTTDEFSEVCFSEINPLKVKIHDLDYSEVRLYRTKIDENTDRAHSIESFVWITSLLTSQGRLPKGTDVTKTVALKVWPNLTRLELMPHAMHMAAVFSKNPGSLLEISKWLNIHQRYVFSFYNAALSLNMIELDSSKIKKSSFGFGKKGAGKKSENRSFFGRLLKRLKS